MAELLLDPSIRMWVILPIVLITVLFGLLRHYIMVLLRSDSGTVTIEQIKDGQALVRSRLLRENGGCIPKESFLMRKTFFDDEEEGYFKKEKRPNTAALAMGDPNMAFEMMKGTLTNVLPMILIGGWINMTFSGFITTKVPFPLTLRFKTMLQRGIELQTLNSSWVSSASWYFLNVFGLRSIYGLILGADNAADHTGQMVQQMSMQGGAGGMGGAQQPNMNQLFKEEWEALQVVQYKDTLGDAEEELLLIKDTSELSLCDPRLKKMN